MMTYNFLHEFVDRHHHPGAMTELKHVKMQLGYVYQMANQIDPEDLLRRSVEVQSQYAYTMDTWRRISVIIDTVTSQTPENDLQAAWGRVSALLATLPSWQNK